MSEYKYGTGLHPDVPIAEYLELPHVSNSRLKRMAMSPAHYRAGTETSTAATEFGTLSHCALLDSPTDLLNHYVVVPEFELKKEYKKPRASNEYKDAYAAFVAANPGKQPVDPFDFNNMARMLKAVRKNDLARRWLQADGNSEVTVIWDDKITGIRCKGRIDVLRDGLVVDYKTTKNVLGFEREINKYAYHRQLAMYLDGVEAIICEPHVAGIIAQEKENPYCARAALVSEEALSVGREAYTADLVRLAECLASDKWPGPDNPSEWTLPAWALERAVEVDMTGVPEEDPRVGVPGQPQQGDSPF